MVRLEELRRMIRRMDHKSYGMYKDLAGSYDCGEYILCIDHVQGDPFASPSRMRFCIGRKIHGFPDKYYDTKERKLALEDQILRRFESNLRRMERGQVGSGKSGRITICRTGQKVMERIAVILTDEKLEVRFEMGFPARGRTILAAEMDKLVSEVLPRLAKECLIYANWESGEKKRLEHAICLADDQTAIRREISRRGLTAFVADGSVLPRENGVSDRPMKGAVPFSSPEQLRVELTLPHRGKLTGMGIPAGVTVIVGGGYHGKSTLLKALEQGVYNHIAGDGREYVISDDTAMKIRAEDGRSVIHTDISMFINHLPGGQDTSDFSTENASGSTSQAANLVEALEMGSRLLLLDEDTCATNFMIRDGLMTRLVPDEKEPITTLLRHIRTLYERFGISFVLVVGSSGDYFSAADHVLQMDQYMVADVTKEADALCEEEGIARQHRAETSLSFPDFSRRVQPARAGRMKSKAMGTDTVLLDREAIDVRYLEQLVDDGQTVGMTYLLQHILTEQKREMPFAELFDTLYQQIEKHGFLAFVPRNYPCGQPGLPRKQELMACMNRYRKARIVR